MLNLIKSIGQKFKIIPKHPLPKRREKFIWNGDGMGCAGPHLLGMTYEGSEGKGIVVEATLLTITVEFE